MYLHDNARNRDSAAADVAVPNFAVKALRFARSRSRRFEDGARGRAWEDEVEWGGDELGTHSAG